MSHKASRASEFFESESIYENAELLQKLKDESISYCITNGAIMMESEYSATHAPISLLPRPIPRETFQHVTGLSPLMNELYDKVGRDHQFLLSILEPVAMNDPFINMLITILKKSIAANPDNAGMRQSLSLLLTRSDYMIHEEDTGLPVAKQIEMNMISAAFASLSTKVTDLHKYITFNQLSREYSQNKQSSLSATSGYGYSVDDVPVNAPLHGVVDAFAETVKLYHEQLVKLQHPLVSSSASSNSPYHGLCVLMVVQKGEKNSPDQRHLEYTLYSKHNIQLIRASLDDLKTHMSIDSQGVVSVYNKPIAVCYYRSCYTPNDFTSQSDVDIVTSLELAHCVKCPTVGHHLAGTKKIQQVLTDIDVLKKYISVDQCAELTELFMGMWGFDDVQSIRHSTQPHTLIVQDAHGRSATLENGQVVVRDGNSAVLHTINKTDITVVNESQDITPTPITAVSSLADVIVDMAINRNFGNYVLKPQREGGGNNIWGPEIVYTLFTENDDILKTFIIMKRILPRTYKQCMIRKGSFVIDHCISELGIYNAMISSASTTTATTTNHRNMYIGHLLRTKQDGVDEGGVATGYSVLDSPVLYDYKH